MNPIEILNQVSQFYSQAFDKLLALTFGTIGLIGVAVPILVGWVQTKSLRSEKNSLLNELRKELEEERDRLKEFAEGEIVRKVKEAEEKYNSQFEKQSADIQIAKERAEARSFHLQANISSDAGSFADALRDYSTSANHYISANDEGNAQRCLEQIIVKCLPNIDSKVYVREKTAETCAKLLKTLRNRNENQRYHNYIERIERASDVAKERAPKGDTEN